MLCFVNVYFLWAIMSAAISIENIQNKTLNKALCLADICDSHKFVATFNYLYCHLQLEPQPTQQLVF